MSDFMETIFRTTLFLSAGFILLELSIRTFRISTPSIFRFGFVGVLLLGWIGFRPTIDLPVLPTKPKIFEAKKNSTFNSSNPLPAVDSISTSSSGNDPAPNDMRSTRSGGPFRATGFIPILFFCWAGGIIWTLCRGMGRMLRFSRLMQNNFDPPEDWRDEWQSLLKRENARKPIPFRVSEQFGPVLVRNVSGCEFVVPLEYWDSLDSVTRRAVMLHELAHFRRMDWMKSFFVRFLALPHWFNPLARLAVRRFDEAAEWACDEFILVKADSTAADISRALLRLDDYSHAASGVLRSGFRGISVSKRISRIVQIQQQGLVKESTMKKAVVLSLLVLMFLALTVRFRLIEHVQAETPAQTEATSTEKIQTEAPTQPQHDPPEKTEGSTPEPAVKTRITTDNFSREADIVKLLKQKISVETRPGASFQTLFNSLETTPNLKFHVDWPKLLKKGISPETRLTVFTSREITIKSLLDLVLDQYGLIYVVKNNLIYITTSDDNEIYFQEIYYIGDLIVGGKAVVPAAVKLKNTKSYQPAILKPENVQPSDFEPVVDLIKSVVAPDEWKEGKGEIMPYFPNLSLVVRQNKEIHAEIVDLLNQLRKLNDLQVRIEFRSMPADSLWDETEFTKIVPKNAWFFNGQGIEFENDWKQAAFVQIVPSEILVQDEKQNAAIKLDRDSDSNKPISLILERGETFSIQGVVSQDRKNVRFSLKKEDAAEAKTKTFSFR